MKIGNSELLNEASKLKADRAEAKSTQTEPSRQRVVFNSGYMGPGTTPKELHERIKGFNECCLRRQIKLNQLKPRPRNYDQRLDRIMTDYGQSN